MNEQKAARFRCRGNSGRLATMNRVMSKLMIPAASAAFVLIAGCFAASARAAEETRAFFAANCSDCHDADTKSGGLDLAALAPAADSAENFARWVKIHDRVESGEMPPKKEPRPPAAEKASFLKSLKRSLVDAETALAAKNPPPGLRRLTRAEYENTIRDLFDMPGIALAGSLPADGS